MLVINYNGKKPQQRHYDYSIIENNNVDVIKFVLQSRICSYYEFEDLMTFVSYIKIESAGKEYIDKIECSKQIENGFLCVYLYLTKKMTQYKNISVQLSFESGDENNVEVAQTEIVALTLSGSILADKEIDEKYPYAIQQLEQKVNTFDGRIKEADEKAEKAKEIIIGNPSDYLNENGLDKIIRVEDENGNVEKSYFIDKIHHESTLVEAIANTEDETDGELIDDSGWFVDIFGGNQKFEEIFSGNYVITETQANFIVNKEYEEQTTYGIRFGDTNNYGILGLEDCTPNKIIRVIVGKYFEYDEQSNKVFDEHCIIYSDCFANGLREDYREITEEKQVFELETNGDGRFYFDSDGSDLGFGNTRFILYGFEVGEPAYDEYEEHEIGGGGEQQFLPVFKQTQTLQEVYDYFLANKEKCSSDNVTFSFAIMGDTNDWGSTYVARIEFYDTNFYFSFRGDNRFYECEGFDLTQNLSNTLGTIMNAYDYQHDYAFKSDNWDGTQAEYDSMSSHDGNVTYYIREE